MLVKRFLQETVEHGMELKQSHTGIVLVKEDV